MKHRLIRELKAENKRLKATIRELEKRKPIYSDLMSTNIDSLKKYFSVDNLKR